MPSTSVLAAAEGLPNFNRRHLLAGFGAAAAFAVAGGAVVQAASFQSGTMSPAGGEVFSIDERLERLERVAPEAASRLRVRIGALLDAAEEFQRQKKSGSGEAVAAAAALLNDQLAAMHGGHWDTDIDHDDHFVLVSRRLG